MPTRRELLIHAIGTAVAPPLLVESAYAAHTESDSGEPGDYAQRLEKARAATGVTGASFAYWDGVRLHTAVAGLRNSVTRDPVTADTVMHTGSITKLMTTTLLMQLVDDGRMALEDPVVKHLPDLQLRDTRALQLLTCQMLVNHTSGIDGDWLPEYGPDQERIVDTIDRCADLGQSFAPGEETSYCNIALVIAGYMVQTLRSKSWYTLVKDRIYDPLGMRHSLVDPLLVPRFRASIGDLTNPHTGKLFQTSRPFLAPSFAPAGSTQMCTASDLVLFARAMTNDGVGVNGARILSASSAQRMKVPTAELSIGEEPGIKVGLGWFIYPGGVLNHLGGGPGVSSNLWAHPESGRVMALLTNCDKGDELAEAFAAPLLRAWTGKKTSTPRAPTAGVNVTPYLGTYENIIDRFIVSRTADGAELRWEEKFDIFDNSKFQIPAMALHPLGEDTFEARPPADSKALPMTIRFLRRDATGRMRFLGFDYRLTQRVA